jgi:hypothetical protein
MPDAGRGFVAELDAQAGLLRLSGDCRMTDLQELERALAQWRGAGARGIDLSAAGEIDIGPAWLIESALRRGAGNGRPIAATGTVCRDTRRTSSNSLPSRRKPAPRRTKLDGRGS